MKHKGTIKTNKADPSHHTIEPFLSANPVLSSGSFLGGKTESPSLYDVSPPLITTSGRMAIALAIENTGIGPGDQVLIPGYHCSSMVTPIINVSGIPVFYKIKPDMRVDLADIQSKISKETKGLLVTHYFGITQPLSELRSLCDEQGLILIEDCAHAFFGEVEGSVVGSYGDYAIGSLMKFFPVFDGGCLVSSKHSLEKLELSSGGKGFELQSLINLLEIAFKHRKLILLKLLLFIPIAIKNNLWNWIKNTRKNKGKITQTAPAASCGGIDFDPKWIHVRGSLATRVLMKLLSSKRIVNRRKENYHFLLQLFSNATHCRPLFETISDSTVPYVFPLLVDNPDPIFYELRAKGLPLLRWEQLWTGVDATTCGISNHYSRHLIQIPCHQEFTKADLEYMATVIITGLSQSAPASGDSENTSTTNNKSGI